MIRIAIILGSTRPGRKSEAVAKWVYEIAQKRSDAEFELVDAKDFNLPLLDEPMSPIMGQYTHQHTKDWSAKIASFDAYVFVTPEYRSGSDSGGSMRSLSHRCLLSPHFRYSRVSVLSSESYSSSFVKGKVTSAESRDQGTPAGLPRQFCEIDCQ